MKKEKVQSSPLKEFVQRAARVAEAVQLREAIEGRTVAEVSSLAGSAFALYATAVAQRAGGVHLFVSDDRDSAAYLCSDFYALAGDGVRVMFLPSSYKRSIRYGAEDNSSEVQRTAALEAIRAYSGEGCLVVCTCPEALAEKVVSQSEVDSTVVRIARGQRIAMSQLQDEVEALGFERVDFVHEPGQYSVRGGVFDIFSYSENKPFRLDFFGDEVDSVRRFDLSSQLSTERVESVSVVPNLKNFGGEKKESLAEYVGEGAVWWLKDLDHTLGRLDDIRRRLLADSDNPEEDAARVTSAKAFLADTEGSPMVLSKPSSRRLSTVQLKFQTAPQAAFNKQYDLLADDIEGRASQGYTTYILSENHAQFERLENVLAATRRRAHFEPLKTTLHEGFTDRKLRVSLYTDHQIFDRYHRYQLRGGIDNRESLTIAELNQLQVGDYVVHIDHGVGRFGGLVHTVENGKEQESVKLEYRDGDVLLVNVHSLHRIARYKSKESDTPPRVYKLGTGAWQKMKEATKKAVKDIARELIKLYAERKASGGFRFSPDGYLQHELESSFRWEETPDQQKAVELIKADMESGEPMDRLVCGDVGFGKTEVAVRAAFKAACDSKQVAVLVPTTILSLQHYRTFAERMRGLPVRVDYLSRTRSTKEVKQILADLEAGRIDIIVGTHKLVGKDVKFNDLGLLIIDEEQKFGVAAKEKLRQMSVSVDTLTLTATPIPRTLQFSLMGARDLSVISTPPPNRQPIVTESHTFDEAIISEALDYELGRGGQLYFVHNRVEDIERIAALVKKLRPEARVVVGHGQMQPQQLEKVVMDFIYGEYDVLVATTIVENGIDIPNANTIIINNAQNFGLSDLHQLRGRVGRSDRKSFCYLLSPPDELLTSEARRRLRAIEEFSELGSGFNIAMQDLDIRGAGNLLGAEQSGFIADMGFETYQRILSEAVAELRAEGVEGLSEVVGEEVDALSQPQDDICYVSDCQVETDVSAVLPNSYVSQPSEKLRLYRRLDNITDEEEMGRFVAELEDRFGRMPKEAKALVDVVRLRWKAMSLGIEKAKVKNGLMLLWFPADGHSPYYKSYTFGAILRYVSRNASKFVLKQNNNKVYLTVRNIGDLACACATIDALSAEIAAEREQNKV
ncbi:MAG: transcription-repair coupling factor [Tidjanibacter sp.]|nr:transcription-repair coupling factor [Tidjanibacter sp.]